MTHGLLTGIDTATGQRSDHSLSLVHNGRNGPVPASVPTETMPTCPGFLAAWMGGTWVVSSFLSQNTDQLSMHTFDGENNHFTFLPHKSEHKHWDTQGAQESFLETVSITQGPRREGLVNIQHHLLTTVDPCKSFPDVNKNKSVLLHTPKNTTSRQSISSSYVWTSVDEE